MMTTPGGNTEVHCQEHCQETAERITASVRMNETPEDINLTTQKIEIAKQTMITGRCGSLKIAVYNVELLIN